MANVIRRRFEVGIDLNDKSDQDKYIEFIVQLCDVLVSKEKISAELDWGSCADVLDVIAKINVQVVAAIKQMGKQFDSIRKDTAKQCLKVLSEFVSIHTMMISTDCMIINQKTISDAIVRDLIKNYLVRYV